MQNLSEKVAFIWSVADLLRGDDEQSEHGPAVRESDVALAPIRVVALAAVADAGDAPEALRRRVLREAARDRAGLDGGARGVDDSAPRQEAP